MTKVKLHFLKMMGLEYCLCVYTVLQLNFTKCRGYGTFKLLFHMSCTCILLCNDLHSFKCNGHYSVHMCTQFDSTVNACPVFLFSIVFVLPVLFSVS